MKRLLKIILLISAFFAGQSTWICAGESTSDNDDHSFPLIPGDEGYRPMRPDSLPPDGPIRLQLPECGFKSESMKRLIEYEFIPMLRPERYNGCMFSIRKAQYDTKKYDIRIIAYEINDCMAWLHNCFGWFEREGLLFIADKDVCQYFTELPGHEREIEYMYRYCEYCENYRGLWYYKLPEKPTPYRPLFYDLKRELEQNPADTLTVRLPRKIYEYRERR